MTKDQQPHDCFINLGSHDITSHEITPKHLHSWQIRLRVGYDYNIKATEMDSFEQMVRICPSQETPLYLKNIQASMEYFMKDGANDTHPRTLTCLIR